MVTRSAAAIAFALALLVGAGRAAADAKAEREARALFTEGNKLLDAGDYVGALDLYEAAYQKFPNAKILVNMGTCLRSLGRNAEAATVYEKYLADPNANPALVKEVKRLLDELGTKLAMLVIEVEEPGARVMLDGKEIGLSPQKIKVRVETGSHMVAAEKEGYTSTLATVSLTAGEERSVQLKLLKAGTPPPVGDKDGAADKDKDGDVAALTDDTGTTDTAATDGGTDAPTIISRSGLSHGGHLGALARWDFDGKGRGSAGTIGLTYGLGDRLELAAAGIVGQQFGAWVGGSFFFSKGTWKPNVTLGVPVYFLDTGTLLGAHAAVGVQWDPSARIGILLSVGAQIYFGPPEGMDQIVPVPSLGLQFRL
jgi:hypothetical protein